MQTLAGAEFRRRAKVTNPILRDQRGPPAGRILSDLRLRGPLLLDQLHRGKFAHLQERSSDGGGVIWQRPTKVGGGDYGDGWGGTRNSRDRRRPVVQTTAAPYIEWNSSIFLRKYLKVRGRPKILEP